MEFRVGLSLVKGEGRHSHRARRRNERPARKTVLLPWVVLTETFHDLDFVSRLFQLNAQPLRRSARGSALSKGQLPTARCEERVLAGRTLGDHRTSLAYPGAGLKA